jgi:dipeptidase
MITKRMFTGVSSFVAVFLLAFALFVAAVPCEGCFSIVVGKNASVDGYVIMAHNEDDLPPQIVNHHKMPRGKHSPSDKVQLINGGQLDQVEQTWSYIWSEMPGMLFSDSYVNEWGVCVTSDNCPSREDKPEISNGGIGYMLRRLVAERAKSARDGVLLAGKLVERFGYVDSGRTYIICDPDEGWLFCVVNGKHWLARRVPDDEVAMVANTFTVHRIDLSDNDNFLASDGIIKYAVSRGWHNPQEDGPFDFANVYANPRSASDISNVGRQWSGLRYIAAEPIPLGPKLPFSVVPQCKLSVADIMQVLRHDYYAKELQSSLLTENTDRSLCTICRGITQTSFVAQLRRNVPLDIGIVYWVCLAPPATSFYIPFHFGISDFPAGYSSQSQRPLDDLYQGRVSSAFQADPLRAFWTFSNFYNKVQGTSDNRIKQIKAQAENIEKNAFILQKPLEEAAYRLYKKDKITAMKMLSNYSDGIYLSAIETMGELLAGE